MKKLLLFLLSLSFSLTLVSAQKSELKFKIKKGAKSINFVYRLDQLGASAKVDLEEGETAQLNQTSNEELIRLEYTFKKVVDKERTMTIDASHLEVLRFSRSKAIDGVLSLISPSLKKLNLDYTKLSTPKLDFSKCPNIEEITLNDCDVEEVDLPEEPKLKSFQASPAFLSKKGIKRIDLSQCKDLEDLSLNGTSVKVIDLRACPKLKQLVIKGIDTKHYPQQVFGLKAMKNLELVSISLCYFSYDMLPDRNNTDIEKFRINRLYGAYIPSDRVKGLVVDLSHLREQKGVSPTKNITSYRWVRWDKIAKKYINLPTDKITEKDGVFTFDKSILGDAEELKVRCMLDNAGYNTLEKFSYWKSGYKTNTLTLKELAEIDALEQLDVAKLSIRIVGNKAVVEGVEAGLPYKLFSLEGRCLEQGVVGQEAFELTLPTKAVYILQIGNSAIKLAR